MPIQEVTFAHIERIFEITDRLGIHREALVIPLGTRNPGGVRRTRQGKIEILVDSERNFEDFLSDLEESLRGLGV